MTAIFHFLMNLNTSLPEFVGAHGWLIYPLLFAIIFLETGLVVTPFLPGDSIIFAAAALCPLGKLNIWLLILILVAAAILGNTSNYFIGRALSNLLKNKNKLKFIKRQYISDAQRFFDKYGAVSIVLTRFMPIVRTFMPFVAGAGHMKRGTFMIYNCVGGVLWVGLFSLLGYAFGNIPVVQEYYDLVIIGIVCVSVLPIVITKLASIVKRRRARKNGEGEAKTEDDETTKEE